MQMGFLAAASWAACLVVVSGCSSSGASSPGPDAGAGSQSDSGGDANAADTGSAGDASDDVLSGGPATLRVANLSPDTAGLDFCIKPRIDASYGAPKLASLGSVGDGGSGGLPFPSVTRAFQMPSGAYALRVVAAGAADCSTSLATDLFFELHPQTATTVALAGDLSLAGNDPAVALYRIDDDVAGPASGIGLRFLHAAPGVSLVDLGTGTEAAGSFQPMLKGVSFGTVSSQGEAASGTVDANGYLARAAMKGQAMSVRMVGTTTDLVTASVTLGDGALATLFLVGGKTGDASHPPQLFTCDDLAPGAGALAKCALLGP